MSYRVSKKTGYPVMKDKDSILEDPAILIWQDEINRIFSEMTEIKEIREQFEAPQGEENVEKD